MLARQSAARRRVALVAAAICVMATALLGAPAAPACATTASTLTPAQVRKHQWWITALDLKRTWRLSEGAGQIVAVLDSGVDARDGDLKDAVLPGFSTTGSGNAMTDTDPAQHGTRMADNIAARGTGFGLLGIARKAAIMPVYVPTRDEDRATITALNRLRAMASPPGIVNMSFGASETCSPALQRAVTRAVTAGMILVASAGNDGESSNAPQAPAVCKGVVAVGAIDSHGKVWAGSNTGSYVSLVAPGVHMIGEDHRAASGAGYGTGTSDSSALVAGALADVRAKFPNEPPRRIVARLLYTAKQMRGAGHTRNDRYGYGIALPSLAMLRTVPADAPNPIYDAIGLTRAHPTAAPSSRPASATPRPTSSAPGSTGPDSTGPSGQAASGSGGSGTPIGLIIGLIAAMIVIALAVTLLVRSRRQPGYSGPPPGNP